MWLGFSQEARAALRSPTGHKPMSRVDILHGGRPVYQLAATEGNVQTESNTPVRASLSCRLVDPTGDLTEGDANDLLNAYDCEIAPHRGVKYRLKTYGRILTPNAGFGIQPFGTSGFGGYDESTVFTSREVTEYAPLGVFGLTKKQVADDPDSGLVLTLEGQDRAMQFQVPMTGQLAIAGGTSVESAIVRLLTRVDSSLTLLSMTTGHTVGPSLYTPEMEVWEEAQKLAASSGAVLYHDRTGQCVLMPAGPNLYPVASYNGADGEGDGLLLGVDRTEDSDSIANVVVAVSTDGSIRVVAFDDDPTSPTYAGGRYGARPQKEPLQLGFMSVAQAAQAATAELIRELGRKETVSFSAVPDFLDPDDVVIVNRPQAGLTRRAVVVDSVDMPLAVDGVMRVSCRTSILTQDGQVLPEEAA
jgi:hypothetical protein